MVDYALVGWLAKEAALRRVTSRSKSSPASSPEGRREALAGLDESPPAAHHAPTRYGRSAKPKGGRGA